MAELRLGFDADTGAAIRSINELQKVISKVAKDFNEAEVGSREFARTASELSQLTLGLKTARGAVVDIDKAYRDLNKAVEANFAVQTKALGAATKYHKDVLQLAQESAKEEDRLRNKNFQAEQDDWDRRLKIAVAAKNKIAAQEKAIMEFRAGMGAKGAIPEIASPVRGGVNFPDSPDYKKAMADAAAKAARQTGTGGGVVIPAELKFQPFSLAYYESKLKALSAQARLISPESKQWRELNTDILKAERGIERIQKRQRLGPTMGQRAGAAGGAFLYGGGLGGGVGSALGGIAGGLAGGVPGAFAGAAIGQAVDNLGTALAGITSQASQVQQLQRGLALASIDAKDFAEAQAAVADVSTRLFIPLEQVTKSFSQLRVNTKQYGLSVEETKQILEGTILAVSAFGGSADDVDGAMRAVVQILSKGSVQAEELRGQLGERFPGAVIKFAQANKLSFDELQDRLKEGSIGIKEFVTFAKKNYEDYAAFSEKLATAPEFAGRRLQIALEQISLEIGGLFGPMGAGIQDLFTSTINNIAQFIKENRGYLRQMISDFSSIVGPIAKVFIELMKVIANFSVQVGKIFQGLFAGIRQALGMASIGEAKARLDRAKAATTGKTRPTRNARGGGTTTNAEFIELEAAQRAFSGLGGQAAFTKANAPAQPSDLIFGGPGAGVDMTAGADKAAKEKAAKQQSLESFERLRDQLANAYNQAEIERIKQRYELEKRLRDDLFDRQEFGANRLQRQALGFLRSLVKAEDERAEAVMSARLAVAAESGKVAGGAGVSGISGGGFSTAQLQKASQEAARFTGVANMCSESVKAFYKSLGISLPGVTAWADTVRNAGQTMTDWSKLQAGDIVATGRPGDTPHVGVYTGGNNVFHQSRKRGLKAGNYPDLDYFKSGYFVRPNAVGAGSPRKVGSNESRDTMAVANLEIAQATVLETARGAQLAKNSALMREFEKFAADAYNIPDLELDNRRLAERNRLAEQGLDENAINYQLRLLDIEEQRQFLIAKLPEFIRNNNYEEKDHVAILGLLAAAIAKVMGAEKKKNDETLRGIEEQRQRDITKRIDALKTEVEILRLVSAEERRLAELRKEGLSEAQAKELFDLEKIKKNIEDTRALIDGFVSQTSSDYKGFLKAVISGEDAADALKQFQEGLKDRVLTIFLDFAMAPVEKFLKESLEGLFLPKAKKEIGELPKETTKDPVEATNSNTNATNTNTTEIKNLTTAIQGMAAGTNAAPSIQGPTAGNAFYDGSALPSIAPGFDAGSVFGGGGPTGGIFDTISQQMGGATESLSSFSSHMSQFIDTGMASADAVGSWGDSFNTKLSDSLTKATDTTNQQGATFQESLGKTVGAIGIAAGAIMGIAAGIGQIKKGGTSNILGGIGSIMTSIGGGIMGFMGMFGANGGVAPKGWKPFPAAAFANGGMVTGPTLGLVGEGKYNEAIVPLPDGRSIPVQMRGGSSRDLLDAPSSASAAPTMLSMSFQSTTINGVEYVDRAQLEAAMAETRKSAARDGASRGALLALDKLQNSPSARRRVGIR